MFQDRVLSGMRPTGAMHLGHYHGALKNWVKLQNEHPCLFFAADWHALTTHYETPEVIEETVWEMFVDWLCVGIDPSKSTLFVQSKVPQHAELTLLLSFFQPLSWLERVPTYKDQIEKLGERGRDLTTYGFLGYPLMQAADILIYRATQVPVGEDQVSHIELTREIARRFNHLFGKEKGFEEKAEAAVKKMGPKKAKLYRELRTKFQQAGDEAALASARTLVGDVQNLTLGDKERLYGYLEGGGRVILVEPEAILTETPKLLGLDGEKMSKSYGNTIMLREKPEDVTKKIRTMPTDPARVRRTDPGDPEKCPVWNLHQVYSDQRTKDWVVKGCKSASIGCLDCKQPVIDAINAELKPIRERAAQYEEDPTLVRNIVQDGCEKASDLADETMRDVREAMGLNYA
ncbi:tryptophan--tRNA ligase [Usitatibacter palustris]|uniref:Tryptophan--tRNA ligase n=1 Tax=Usitatibacter palustris TaxID=2732487 RepID=A0A6M4H6R2_9PROT|nr:tryptophan--tRNA ligase [Usitatibacter palustris]QJR14104.1 Tryptophan--tRNA ligase [Usitatibacter palustris]